MRPMPYRAPEGHDPTEIFPFPVGRTPRDERGYFEILTWFVFGAGLNWRVMRAKWPRFTEVFRNFDPAAVAGYTDRDVDRLLADPGIVRNGKKVVGTIENAGTIRQIAHEHDGMTAWIRSYRDDVDALVKDVKKRFRHMGDTTARMFLTCVGAIEYGTWQPTERQRMGAP